MVRAEWNGAVACVGDEEESVCMYNIIYYIYNMTIYKIYKHKWNRSQKRIPQSKE